MSIYWGPSRQSPGVSGETAKVESKLNMRCHPKSRLALEGVRRWLNACDYFAR